MSFLPAVSRDATKRMMREMRSWKIHWNTPLSLHELAERYNPILRGWLNYYGTFYKSAMRRILITSIKSSRYGLDASIRHSEAVGSRVCTGWAGLQKGSRGLFIHWLVFGGPAARAMGAV